MSSYNLRFCIVSFLAISQPYIPIVVGSPTHNTGISLKKVAIRDVAHVDTPPSGLVPWAPKDLLQGTEGALAQGLVNENSLILDAAKGAERARSMAQIADQCNLLFGEVVEVPATVVEEVAVLTTEGEVIGAGIAAEAGAGVTGLGGGVTAALEALTTGGAVDFTLLGVETAALDALLAVGPVTLGLSVALAAALTAAGVMVMPLIEAFKDRRETVRLHGFVIDIDGDGKPDYVNDYMSKLTPNNPFLYHKLSGIQAFFNHLFKKKEQISFDYTDETLGPVTFRWKGDAQAGQNQVLGILQQDISAEEMTEKIWYLLSSPNQSGNKDHDKMEITADTDHDGLPEYIKMKFSGNNDHHGHLKIEGDIDGDGIDEKCKWHDDHLRYCKHES